MPDPDLLQRQRETLRTFRQATDQRAKTEAGAEAQRRAERETADKLLHKAQQEAQTQRTTAEAKAEARRKSEQQAAGAALKQVQQAATTQLAEARKAQEEAHAALTQAGLERLR
ncbi:MAG: hypothetical protein ACE5LU_11650 [Anaerolineae bacterium]